MAAESLDIARSHVVARVMEGLLRELDFARLERAHRDDVARLCRERVDAEATPAEVRQVGGDRALEEISGELADDLIGAREFFALLQTEGVSDVLVNGSQNVYVERGGRLQRTSICFPSEKSLRRTALWMTSRVGRPVHDRQPMVDARLPDGSRINVIVPPLAVDGTVLSIRKFTQLGLDLAGLAQGGAFPAALSPLIQAVVACRLNLLVSGGTGSGKTTLLNALSESINEGERVVTIEDSAELRLRQAHVVRLETRLPDASGDGEVSTRALVRNALRMRPDRILVGEVRGAEALDMLQAMNTGHEGSMSTIHANSPRDALDRLETMVGMADVALAETVIRRQLARSLDLVIHLRRLPDGRRVVEKITEVGQLQGEVVAMQDIFQFQFQGELADGRCVGTFAATGIRPALVDRLERRGFRVSPDLWRIQQQVA
jgi:pilus assembly protein CpaF